MEWEHEDEMNYNYAAYDDQDDCYESREIDYCDGEFGCADEGNFYGEWNGDVQKEQNIEKYYFEQLPSSSVIKQRKITEYENMLECLVTQFNQLNVNSRNQLVDEFTRVYDDLTKAINDLKINN